MTQRVTREIRAQAPEALAVPTIHLNGTSKAVLAAQFEQSHQAIEEAIQVVERAAPNGRDYYPQGPEAHGRADVQHYRRLLLLRAVQLELVELWEAITQL